jgi:hypothetical protein
MDPLLAITVVMVWIVGVANVVGYLLVSLTFFAKMAMFVYQMKPTKMGGDHK